MASVYEALDWDGVQLQPGDTVWLCNEDGSPKKERGGFDVERITMPGAVKYIGVDGVWPSWWVTHRKPGTGPKPRKRKESHD